MAMANAVEDHAKGIKGKKSLAVLGFAKALKTLPMIIAENGGFDSSELVQNLCYDLRHGKSTVGLDMEKGTVGDMEELGIYESLLVKEQAVISATEAAEMILRVDVILHCAPRERSKMGVHN